MSRAVVVWTGWGETASPLRDDNRLVETFGEDVALDLIAAVHALEEEFYESDANLTAHDLVAMSGARQSTSVVSGHRPTRCLPEPVVACPPCRQRFLLGGCCDSVHGCSMQ